MLHCFRKEKCRQRLKHIKFDIITTDETPVCVAPYRVLLQKQILKEHINQMLEAGIIKPGKSEYAAPVHLVPKPNWKMRLVSDFKKLNSITRVDPYPLVPIQQIFHSLSQSCFYTTLNALHSYHTRSSSLKKQKEVHYSMPVGQIFI